MFARRFFPGRYFAPRYWPQSQGEASTIFNPDIELTLGLNRTASIGLSLNRTITFTTDITG